ncbi:hypothetical protein GE09DRAFT_1290540 [Coniochaeta sp. 2T2.1]|nr:hypothetical protein GE09DRAFT_1290540 [Coniochaeta sp. 2T2.1]
MHLLHLTTTALLAVVSAYDPSKRDCKSLTGSDLCLTSFTWCNFPTNGDRDSTSAAGPGCAPPAEGGYLRGNDATNAGSIYAILIAGVNYNISGPATAKWEKNTTDPYLIFNPTRILSDFPTELAPDLNSDLARGLAAADFGNMIEISQPEHPPDRRLGTIPRDVSQLFTVQDGLISGWFESAAETSRKDEKKKWRLGVGIGVGVGVPIMIAVAAWVGWTVGRKRGRRTAVVGKGGL